MKKTNLIMIPIMVIGLLNSCQYSDTSPLTQGQSRKDSIDNQDQTEDKSAFNSVSKKQIGFDYSVDKWLKIGLSESIVREKLGTPDSLGKALIWEAIGLEVHSIYYFEKGIKLEIEDDGLGNTKIISILLTSPCTSTITHSIGIGSSKQDLVHAYGDRIDRENSTKNSILIGSVYDGVLFTLESERVTEIFIGSIAE